MRRSPAAAWVGRGSDPSKGWADSDLGRAAYHLLTRGLAPTLIGVVVFKISLPAFQVFWAVVLLLACQGVLALARRKVVVQGG